MFHRLTKNIQLSCSLTNKLFSDKKNWDSTRKKNTFYNEIRQIIKWKY